MRSASTTIMATLPDEVSGYDTDVAAKWLLETDWNYEDIQKYRADRIKIFNKMKKIANVDNINDLMTNPKSGTLDYFKICVFVLALRQTDMGEYFYFISIKKYFERRKTNGPSLGKNLNIRLQFLIKSGIPVPDCVAESFAEILNASNNLTHISANEHIQH
jgi:hypothetical protein